MRLHPLTPPKALNKAYLKQSLKREQIELFKANLILLFDRVNEKESEENLKNIVSDFLKDTWYKTGYEINTKDRADLVIHNGKSSADSVGVLVEVKRPTNKNEMISPERPNAKALHELLHYYMQERYIRDNKEIRHLIVCNIYEWYIFDAADFERFFFANRKFVESYRDWNNGMLVGTNTDWFYQTIARDFIEKNLTELPCTYFNLKDFEKTIRKAGPLTPTLSQGEREQQSAADKKLINLYKLLSPAHLLKQSFANDSNSLNREFYNELLHIIGLEEVKEKGKKLIQRRPAGARHDGSLLENTFGYLKNRNRLANIADPQQFGANEDEQYFSIALELCITWLNRLLFLKLLEGQLIAYHKGDRAYAFLNSGRISDFDELDEMFFDVLAVRVDERNESVKVKFGTIPYLNSSLFEESDLERDTMRVNELKNRHDLPIYGATVLKEANGKRRSGGMNTLHYLFEFLDAYDFASEGSAEIQEQNKTIINASVLGLIFEKINGYKDGSFFTPGFITMYMCRETIRRAVVRKFNERYGWCCKDITELHNDLYRQRIAVKEANEVVNSLKICDPAVGSGHFLVSALNELIAVKAELGLLADKDGKLLRCDVSIENDEIIITRDDGIFVYNYKDQESQRVQETLFHEKETIIENCLFGVDINPKSVAICRLRLWIELLKSAYYRAQTANGHESRQLETLPNIDINIKCGNSLVSRFAITGNPNAPAAQRKKLKELTAGYRDLVLFYKHSPSNKTELRKRIDNLKHDLENFGLPNDRELMALWKAKEELAQMSLFAYDRTDAEKRQKLQEKVAELERRFEEKQRLVYANAFEWRFEFPEVLDENGEFVGFDVVIGNPPYIRQEAIKEMKPALTELFGGFFCGTADIYTYFYKTGLDVAKPGGALCYIAPNKFMRAGYGRNTRELLISQAKPLMVLDFGDLPIFEEATTYPSIVLVEKICTPTPALPHQGGGRKKVPAGKIPPPLMGGGEGEGDTFLAATFTDPEQLTRFAEALPTIGFTMPVSALKAEGWTLERPEVLGLMEKLRKAGKPLGEYVEGKFYYGIKTGLNEAFVIDEETRQRLIAEDPKSAEIIKPWLRGRDIRKWQAQWAELYIIFTRRGTDIEQFPAIKRHLEQFREYLEPKKTSEEEHGRKPGPYKWFEIQDNIAYFEEFETPKIVYPDIARAPQFLWDDSKSYLGNTAYFIPTDEFWLVGLLNSRALWWFYGTITSSIRGGFVRYFSQYIEQLPIPTATDAQKALIIERAQKILAAPDSPDVPQLEAEIDRLVYELYGLTEEEIAVVEGR
jgi:adenine-specific DNA-methyltransferase